MMKFTRTKVILTLFAAVYALAISFFIFQNSGNARHILIQKKTAGGIVLINHTRFKTPYKLEQAQITVKTENILDYVFLSTGEGQDAIIGAAVKLLMVLLTIRLIILIDFNDPFRINYLKQVQAIFGLYFLLIAIAWIRSYYTTDWLRVHYPGSSYTYQEDIYGLGLFFKIVVAGAVYNIYAHAVSNRDDLALTI